MKYIRTKDGRILEWEKFNEITKLSIDTCEEPIKISDNIEKLCDEFVTAYIDGFHQLSSFPSEIYVILGHSVYGAIWTDKGLIYVAKMNKKGEFELL